MMVSPASLVVPGKISRCLELYLQILKVYQGLFGMDIIIGLDNDCFKIDI